MYRFISVLLLLFVSTLSAQAADSGWLVQPQNTHAQVRVLASEWQEGQVKLLLNVELESGWKTYWHSPGEGGVAPEIEWNNLPNTSPIETQWYWPTPSRFDVAGISTQGYSNQVVFPLVIKSSTPLENLSGTLTLSTCSNVCILTDYPINLSLNEPAPADFSWLYSQAMSKTPAQEGMVDNVNIRFNNSQLQVDATRLAQASWQTPQIFFDVSTDYAVSAPQITTEGDRLIATVNVTDDWGDKVESMAGVPISIVISDKDGSQQIDSTIEQGQIETISSNSYSLVQLILFALLGGLILNLMPCVLPVLAMKLGSILYVQNRDKRAIRMQFVVSSSGILVSFWLLALLVTGLRLTQSAVGWGIQFQNPWFIGFMVLVTAFFTANLFGLFEIQLNSNTSTRLATAGGNGLRGHFLQGVFATLLATPCSAPFLGTAVAFALAAPLPQLWIIFTALGIGMSLPWLMIALFPSIARALPKPGRWMFVLRIVLGGMMLFSCLWLISLLIPHTGILIASLIVGLLLLIIAIYAFKHNGFKRGLVSVLILAFIGGVWGDLNWQSTQSQSLVEDTVDWQPLTEEAITEALAQNKRVFIDITADWCVTCKANKYNVLLREDIQDALNASDIVALRGDWTKPSESINHFLHQRGQYAVPFNQIYGPNLPQGEILSPLLDRQTLLNLLNQAQGTKE